MEDRQLVLEWPAACFQLFHPRRQWKILRFLIGTDFPAGDFFSRISRGLCFKIIGHHVDDHCAADYFIRHKLAGVENRQCVSAASEQRRKISCVGWVRTIVRIPMLSGIGKCFLVVGTAAAFALMNVETMDMDTAGVSILWKCLDFGQDKCAAPAGVEIHHTPDIRKVRASTDYGICLRRGIG